MSLFTKIAEGEIPSYKCAENEEFYAILDNNPLVKDQLLLAEQSVLQGRKTSFVAAGDLLDMYFRSLTKPAAGPAVMRDRWYSTAKDYE